MVCMEVSNVEIARATNLTESRIVQIKDSDGFKELLAQTSYEKLEEQQTINDAWDAAEFTAVGNLLKSLEWNSDPDFALKVAMIANKARRRGEFGNRPIDGQVGARAVLNLSTNFVVKLQQNGDAAPKQINGAAEKIDPPQKDSNILNPDAVEKLLMPNGLPKPKTFDVSEALDFFPRMEPAIAGG